VTKITVNSTFYYYHSEYITNEQFVNCKKQSGNTQIVLYDENVIILILKQKLKNHLKGVVVIMAQPGLDKKTSTKVEDQSSLKGTLASVFLLGFFLIITWVGVFLLFVNRF
jgi:hypothetical protein